MANILLTRIDNRLIHGQVATQWVSHVSSNLILVANDEVANDEMQQNLMDMAVSGNVETRYFTIDETIEKIPHASDKQRILLIVRTPQDVVKLVEGGVPIKEVNVGNMHFSEKKQRVSQSIFVDENEKMAFKTLSDLNVVATIKRVPTDKGENIINLI